jgi:hypothetical protein
VNDRTQIPKRWRGQRWSALAASVRARNPICERCKERFSEEVHHSVPLHKGGSLYDPRNLVALCKQCHHDITTRLISQIRASKFSPNNEPDKNPIISTEQRPFSSNNEGMAEASSAEGTALRGQPCKYPKSTNNRASLGVRIKWQPKKIK